MCAWGVKRVGPPGFFWINEGRLAGSGLPGLIRDLEADLQFLDTSGIRVIVTLTHAVLQMPRGLDYQPIVEHFPIDDMGFPTPRQAGDLCRKIGRWEEGNLPVLLHCRAGLGRTGTMLACYLVSTGATAPEAIQKIRSINPGFIQTDSQLAFVGHFQEFWQSAG